MTYSRTLPLDLRKIILKDNINVPELLIPYNLNGHGWCEFDTNQIVSESGRFWFNHLGVDLSPKVALFKLDKFYTGPIHIDAVPQKFGFNFVMEGTGDMQWVNIEERSYEYTSKTEKCTSTPFKRFNNTAPFTVIETWLGTDGLIRVDIPHRVIGGSEDRYTISIRPSGKCNYTFDDMVQILSL